MIARIPRLGRDRRGATAVEFGIVALPLLLAILAGMDLAFRQYMAVQLQGTLYQAARRVTVGGANSTTINNFITNRMQTILPGTTVSVVAKGYDDFTSVGKAEPITTDTPPLGVYSAGDCFLDENGNGRWDADSGSAGYGSGDDVIYYIVTASFPAVVPLGRMLGWSSTESVTATMMMRNQPYAAQAQPVILCP